MIVSAMGIVGGMILSARGDGIAGMGNYFGAGIQSAVSGYLVGRDAATGKAVLLGHTFANGYTLDYLSVFWIGMALLSVICALSVWKARPRFA